MAKPDKNFTNKELMAMTSLMGMGCSIADCKSFLRIIAPKWPDGKKILYDLLGNKDLWMTFFFTYDVRAYSMSNNPNRRVYEIALKVFLKPEHAGEFCKLAATWPIEGWEMTADSAYVPPKHNARTRKVFRTKLDPHDYSCKHRHLVVYHRVWLVDRE